MAALTIENTLRPCLVRCGDREHKALFHGFWTDSRVHGVKQVSAPVAIVELENGKMRMVHPTNITFIDKKIEEYSFGEDSNAT